MRVLRRAAVAAALMLLAATPVTASATTQLGAFANEPGGIAALESQLGVRLTIDHLYEPWNYAPWKQRVAPDIAAGRTPLLSWSAAPATTAADIAAGTQDAVITRAADALASVGATVYLRPFYEFDQPAGHPRYIGTPAEVAAAWQRMVDIFRAEGATNVKFVWCPMAFDFSNGIARQYWPGAGYVDYVGADGYDFPGSRWVPFGRIFRAAYRFSVAEARPLFIGETAATATDPRVGSWLSGADRWLQLHPYVAAVIYFDSVSPKGYDFRLLANPSAFTAFQSWVLDPYFG